MATTQSSLDSVLYQLGDFGRYQCFVFVLISFGVILHSMPHIAFVFAARGLDYRCKVPECDDSIAPEFNSTWLANAVPFDGSNPKNCERFQYINLTSYDGLDECPAEQFDRNVIEGCTEYVYKTGERTILVDFDLHCDENLWKLTLVGTINTVGQFVGLPLSGVLSDRFGRRTLLIVGMIGCGIFGVIRSFMNNYVLFLIFEFLDALFLSGTYACCFILGVELVGPNKRVLAGTIICYCFAIGEVITAGLAWWIQSWRPLLLTVYSPLFLFISYYWIAPESVRWLLAQKRYDEAEAILLKAAKVNKREISKATLEKLTKPVEEEPKEPFFHVFRSKILLLRFINACFCWITCAFLFYGLTLNSVALAGNNACFCWITCAFLFYGLTLNSVALAGNSYLDFILTALVEIPAYALTYVVVDRLGRRWSHFILTALVEIPAYALTYVVVDRLGRRWSQSGSYFITAIACFVFIFIHEEQSTLRLCFYLLGKFGATAAFTIIYVISSEIFPTPLRHSLMGACSMFGRIGSMVSPQMPLLSALWSPLPLVLFSGMAAVAGLLTLFFPETLNTKLPDTIEEAVNIGKKRKESTHL
ncbi:Sugar transporter [Popillia japonica]|uniref:Sugar transporter n=1 Tax=Popillia japonica TaxID=7064 RepID=A0AAW1HRW8_POPJA